MTTTAPLVAAEQDAALLLARETLYRFFAAVFSEPRGAAWQQIVLDERQQAVARLAADLLHDEHAAGAGELGFGELPPESLDLRPLLAELAQPRESLQTQYNGVFGLVFNRECPPYETEYQRNEDTFFRTQQMADVGGFYRAFGLQPGRERGERPDHIATELEFMALLLLKERTACASGDLAAAERAAAERAAVCRQAQADFLREHLGWWAPAFCQAVRRKAGQGLYFEAASALAALLGVERRALGVPAPLAGVQPSCYDDEPDDCESCGEAEPRLHQITFAPPR